MSISIAGRNVVVGDSLYHIGFRAWGSVTGFDASGPAILDLPGSGGQVRRLMVLNGGIINGQHVVYWHLPVSLNLPRSDISKIQAIVDLVVAEYEA